MHALTLLHRIMGKCQISCVDIEMANGRLGQARNILMFGNMFFYLTLPKSNPKKNLYSHTYEHFAETPP